MLSNNLNELQEEVLGLIQEEAAEIIQELSKIRRTGTHFYRNGGTTPTISFLARELVDFNLLLEIADRVGLFDGLENDMGYFEQKKESLKKWTNIPHSIIESI